MLVALPTNNFNKIMCQLQKNMNNMNLQMIHIFYLICFVQKEEPKELKPTPKKEEKPAEPPKVCANLKTNNLKNCVPIVPVLYICVFFSCFM
jgi:hypothetical protein